MPWTDEIKTKVFGSGQTVYIFYHKLITAFQENNIMLTMNCGGANVMVLGCCAAYMPGKHAVFKLAMNSVSYKSLIDKSSMCRKSGIFLST